MKLGGLFIVCLSILVLIFASCSDDKDAKSSVDKTVPSTSSTFTSLDTPSVEGSQTFTQTSPTLVAIDEVKSIARQDVTLTSIDVDDTAPVFTSPNSFSVYENQISAIKLVATDESAIAYSIHGEDASSFDCNSISGVVTFQTSPDFERKSSYTFTATATDKAKNIARQNIIIDIINIPEMVVIENFTASIDENTTIGTTIGAISILDGDRNITFNEIPNFSIDAKGVITTTSTFDYESKQSYTLKVNATNAVGTSSNISFIVNIKNIGDFYIVSAVYDNNLTPSVLDDKLYLYFDQSIDPNSIAADMSLNYDIDRGVIGSASLSEYNDTNYHKHTVLLNSSSTDSSALVVNETNISIANNILQDMVGNYLQVENNQTILEAFTPILRTGQIKTYSARDDGSVAIGKARSYTREQDKKIVTDNATGLIWQDDVTADAMIWKEAIRYCEDLLIGGFTDWRLADIKELLSLNDYVQSNPAIDPVFENTIADIYWSATTFAYNKLNVWVVGFNNGYQYTKPKSTTGYVRCVSKGRKY